MALEGVADDLVMLALAVAVAAVILVALLVGLYLWALRRAREQAGPHEGTGADGTSLAATGEGVEEPPHAR